MKRLFYLFVFGIITVVLFPQCSLTEKEKKAKYVFYFIGDGMGLSQVNGTEMYMAEKEGRIGIKHLNFTTFPVNNFATTYSSHNAVTCSAAAGTALACGVKTRNGTIGMDSLKQPVSSVAVEARKKGKKVGITSSVGLNHATPAAFYAHQPQRSMYDEICADIVKAGFDFYAGGGIIPSSNSNDSVRNALYQLFNDSGYLVAKGMNAYQSEEATASRVILLPGKDYDEQCLPYAIDRQSEDLILTQITESAIHFLSRDNKNGFFLVVEGGKIDWSAHSNDAATTFLEVMDMADAVQKAIDFYHEHPDETLIVITADHETGGMVLGTGKYSLNLQALQYQQVSKVLLTEKIKQLRKEKHNQVAWNDIKKVLSENLGFWKTVNLNEEQEKILKDIYHKSFAGNKMEMEKDLYSANEPLATTAIKILNDIANVGWASGGHSASVVPVYAIGAGSELFKGKLENTDIPRKIIEAMGNE